MIRSRNESGSIAVTPGIPGPGRSPDDGSEEGGGVGVAADRRSVAGGHVPGVAAAPSLPGRHDNRRTLAARARKEPTSALVKNIQRISKVTYDEDG